MKKNTKLNVIIVDDNKDDQYFIASALSAFKRIDIISFNTGEQLIDYLIHKKKGKKNRIALPDIVIMDIRLPKMSGFEVIEQLKKTGVYPGVRFIILASGITPSDQANCDKHELNCYAKPVSHVQLKSLLEQIILEEAFDFDLYGERTDYGDKRPTENENFNL